MTESQPIDKSAKSNQYFGGLCKASGNERTGTLKQRAGETVTEEMTFDIKIQRQKGIYFQPNVK